MVQLLGISVDGAEARRILGAAKAEVPAARGFELKGRVARLYGVYDDENGTARRAIFVLDLRRRALEPCLSGRR